MKSTNGASPMQRGSAPALSFRLHPAQRYVLAVASTGIATIITLLLRPYLEQGIFSLFLISVMASAWIGGLLGWLAWRRRRQDRARALWDRACARLARAGLPRAAYEGPLAYAERAAARWPQCAKALDVIGHSYAELRYGSVAARADTNLERASALWRLRRAVRILPAAATLRRAPAAR